MDENHHFSYRLNKAIWWLYLYHICLFRICKAQCAGALCWIILGDHTTQWIQRDSNLNCLPHIAVVPMTHYIFYQVSAAGGGRVVPSQNALQHDYRQVQATFCQQVSSLITSKQKCMMGTSKHPQEWAPLEVSWRHPPPRGWTLLEVG